MAEPTVVVDAFKFVAVRSPQRVSDSETQNTVIRDRRTGTEEGARHLDELGRSLAQPEQALRRWEALTMDELDRLVAGHRVLVRVYGSPPTDEDGTPDMEAAIDEAGLRDLDDTGRLTEHAWDALYVARATGADAGQRLDAPLAALRALHFMARASTEESQTRAAAADLLFATPLVPEAVITSRPPERPEPAPVEPARARPEVAQMQKLIDEFDTTHELLRTAAMAPRSAPRAIDEPQTVALGCEDRQITLTQARISTAPIFHAALSERLGEHDQALLSQLRIDEGTSVPAAAMLLEKHLETLTQRALELRQDADFLTALGDRSQPTMLAKIVTPIAPGDRVSASSGPGDPAAPDVDVRGRIRPLGIGDLKVVKQTLLAYVDGEVAHIENVLVGESKERTHRALDRVETTIFASEEESTETERDTQTTERFELKREAEQTIKEDMSVQAGITVAGGYGPVTITAHGDFAYSTSKQESQKSSSNFARGVVDRSVSKLQKKVRTERTTKTLHEVEEINKHSLDNTSGDPEHVVGIYRWVDKRYRAQVYNYGVRLMLEFIVPEPAAFFRASLLKRAANVIGATPPAAFEDHQGKPLTAAAITATSYAELAGRYNTSAITPPPPTWAYTGAAVGEGGLALGATTAKSFKELTVPEGYELKYYEAGLGAIWGGGPSFILQVGGDVHHWLNSNNPAALGSVSGGYGTTLWADSLVNPLEPGLRGVVPVSITAYDVTGYSVNLGAYCLRTDDKYRSWQLQTFEKIRTAYQAAKTEYDQKLAQAVAAVGISWEGSNPGINREIEKRELKKLCITMLTGQHFKSFNAMTDPPDKPSTHPEVNVYEALSEGRIIQYFEQAFEWEHLTYLFYPYFWGRKANWVDISKETDPDPLFAQFRQAGAARVVLPVRPAYNDDVQYYLQSQAPNYTDRIWGGGPWPAIEQTDKDGKKDDRYVSIAEELRNRTDDLQGAKPEGEAWEFTIPTTLVHLQKDSTLPVFAP